MHCFLGGFFNKEENTTLPSPFLSFSWECRKRHPQPMVFAWVLWWLAAAPRVKIERFSKDGWEAAVAAGGKFPAWQAAVLAGDKFRPCVAKGAATDEWCNCTVKVTHWVGPGLGSCGSTGRAWQFWPARRSQGRGHRLGCSSEPPP